MEENILYSPPFVFIVILIAAVILSRLCSRHAFRNNKKSADRNKAYACGEDFQDHLIQPDYSQFFPFAFFFTILHVVALVIATVPTETIETFAIAVLYVGGAVMGMVILLRK